MALDLMCFPYAGAGASVFRPWREEVSSCFQVVPIPLPGREELYLDEAYTDVEHAASWCAGQVVAAHRAGTPFAFFGHSFGAVLAFETARRLVRTAGPVPVRLILSGSSGPCSPPPYRVAGLDDDSLVAGLRELTGYDHEALHDPDLRELLVPALRADLTAHSRYQLAHPEPLPIPITALRGCADTLVSADQSQEWMEFTTSRFELIELPGDHMYFADSWHVLWMTIESVIEHQPTQGTGFRS